MASRSLLRPLAWMVAVLAFLLPLLVLNLRGAEIERPLAVVMIGGLVTSTLFTLLALPTFYELVHRWQGRLHVKKSDLL